MYKFYRLPERSDKDKACIRKVQDCYSNNISDFMFSKENALIERTIYKILLGVGDRDPVMILGDTGSGKTHLACCLEKESLYREKNFLRVSCEQFVDNMMERIKYNNRAEKMYCLYPGIDCIIIDEVEEIISKVSTQTEMANAVVRLSAMDKQVILMGGGLIGEYAEFCKELERKHQSVKLYRLYTLAVSEKAVYTKEIAEKSGLLLSKKALRQLSNTENMGALVGLLNSLLAFTASERRNGEVPVNLDKMKEVFGERLFEE